MSCIRTLSSITSKNPFLSLKIFHASEIVRHVVTEKKNIKVNKSKNNHKKKKSSESTFCAKVENLNMLTYFNLKN